MLGKHSVCSQKQPLARGWFFSLRTVNDEGKITHLAEILWGYRNVLWPSKSLPRNPSGDFHQPLICAAQAFQWQKCLWRLHHQIDANYSSNFFLHYIPYFLWCCMPFSPHDNTPVVAGNILKGIANIWDLIFQLQSWRDFSLTTPGISSYTSCSFLQPSRNPLFFGIPGLVALVLCFLPSLLSPSPASSLFGQL